MKLKKIGRVPCAPIDPPLVVAIYNHVLVWCWCLQVYNVNGAVRPAAPQEIVIRISNRIKVFPKPQILDTPNVLLSLADLGGYTGDAPPSLSPNFFAFMHFSPKIDQNDRLAPPMELAPPTPPPPILEILDPPLGVVLTGLLVMSL